MPCQIEKDRIFIQYDEVIKKMILKLGGKVKKVLKPFKLLSDLFESALAICKILSGPSGWSARLNTYLIRLFSTDLPYFASRVRRASSALFSDPVLTALIFSVALLL